MNVFRTREIVIALTLALSTPYARAQAHEHPLHDAKQQETERGGVDHSKLHHPGMDHPGMEHSRTDPPSVGEPSGKPAPDHVPPPPPAHVMGDMAYDEMVDVMGMDDRSRFGLFALDRLEYVEGGGAAWSARATYGGDENRFVLRSEGEYEDGSIAHADVELLWGHAIAPFWDSRIGLRRDFGGGVDRSWLAFGVEGLAPWWFEVSATAYLGSNGRTAVRLEADYEWLLTQRLVLQPRVELNAYGKADSAAGTGSGLSDASFGLRLRYEIRREFAPYAGIQQSRLFGATADHARAEGDTASDLAWVAGVRIWF